MYSKQQLEEIAKYLVEHTELNFLEDIAFTGDVSIGGDASVAGDLPVTGDVSIGGDLSVTGSINGEETPSVKPIYYHPIYIIQNTHTDTDDVECRCTLVVMDNSSTPYTATTLLAKLKELMDLGAYIQINGYFKDSSSVVNNIYMAQKFGENDYRVYGNNTAGRTQTAIENIINERTDIADGVNKIN